MKKYFICIATSALLFSCSENNNNDSSTSTQGFAIGVTMASMTDSTQSVDDLNFSWNDSDILAAWDTWTINSEASAFSISSFSEDKSIFEGDILSDVSTLRLFYPYDESLVPASSKIELSLETQSAIEDLSHLNSTTYMLSDVIRTASDDENTEVVMNHVGAIINCVISFDTSAGVDASNYIITSLTMGTDGESEVEDAVYVPLTGELNLASGSFETATSGLMTINTEISAIDDKFYIPFNSFPFTIAAGEQLTLIATFFNTTDLTSNEVEATIGSDTESIEIAAASNVLFNIKLSDSPETAIVGNLIVNGNFEEEFEYWNDGVPNVSTSANAPEIADIVDDENVISGSYSLRFHHDTAAYGNAIATQLVTVEVGKTYAYGYTVYIVEENNSSAYANMNIQYYSSSTTSSNIKNDTAEVLSCYTRGEVMVVTGGEVTITDDNVKHSPNGDQVIIFLQKPQGIVYFDDVWFKEI